MTEQHAAPIDSVTDLTLLFLLDAEEKGQSALAGTTRLQKLMFLLTQRPDFQTLVKEGKAPDVRFHAYRMGPFTPEIYEAVELLSEFDPPLITVAASQQREGDLELDRYVDELDLDRSEPAVTSAPRPTLYRLTPEGRTVALQLRLGADPAIRTAISAITDEFGSLPLRELLRRVYRDFPTYTSRSEIKEQLGIPSRGS